MTIIILNSGRGSRLGNLTGNNTKCMTKVSESDSILSLQLRRLKKAGYNEAFLTTGYLSEVLKKYVESLHLTFILNYIYNKDWETTNYIVSLDNLYGIKFDQDIILMHGDLVFSYDVLASVINYPGSCVVVDSLTPLPDKDFKARVDDKGYIQEIGVNTFGIDCMSCQPLYKLTLSDWRNWQKTIHNFCLEGKTSVYAEDALNLITNKVKIHALDVKGKLCTEIDDQADLARVKVLLEKEGNQ